MNFLAMWSFHLSEIVTHLCFLLRMMAPWILINGIFSAAIWPLFRRKAEPALSRKLYLAFLLPLIWILQLLWASVFYYPNKPLVIAISNYFLCGAAIIEFLLSIFLVVRLRGARPFVIAVSIINILTTSLSTFICLMAITGDGL